MPAVGLKRGRGRPKGSGNAHGPSKVVKNHAPTRRSTRGTTAPRSQGNGDVQVDEHETEEHEYRHASPASDASSAEDPTWELERQILLDEVKGLKNSFSDLEDALRQTQNESASQVQEAIDANKDQIEELRTKNSTLSRQIKEAEEREARLKDRIGVLLCGQPGPSAPASSSRPHPSEPFNDLDSSAEDDASEEDTAAQRPSQQKSDAARKARGKRQPQTRTPWSIRDVKTLINLIMKFGPYYSQLELLWKDFPNVHPRDQRQIKDKARNLKIDFLKKNLPLPPRFDEIRIDKNGMAQIKAARNQY